jgi:hypothetical protein
LAFGCATGIPAYDGCIRYNRVPGQPLLSANHSSFDVGQAFLNGGTGCTANADGTFSAPAGPNLLELLGLHRPERYQPGYFRGFTFGDMPRIIGDVRSQGYFNEDFQSSNDSVCLRRTPSSLRTELFNAFNRHVFTRPDTGVTSGTFGTSFGTVNGQRTVQFTLRYDF